MNIKININRIIIFNLYKLKDTNDNIWIYTKLDIQNKFN